SEGRGEIPATAHPEGGIRTVVTDVPILERAEQLKALHRSAASANAYAKANFTIATICLKALDSSRGEYVEHLVDCDPVAGAQAQEAGVHSAVEFDRVDASDAEDLRREFHRAGDAESVIVVAREERQLSQVVAEALCRSGLSAEAKGREGSDRYKFAHCWNLHSFLLTGYRC